MRSSSRGRSAAGWCRSGSAVAFALLLASLTTLVAAADSLAAADVDADSAVVEGAATANSNDPYPENPVVLARQVEKLNRGVVVVRPTATSAYIGWRLLGDDPTDVAFNVYRSSGGGPAVKLNAAPLTQTTDYRDNSATAGVAHTYYVRAVINGREAPPSETIR